MAPPGPPHPRHRRKRHGHRPPSAIAAFIHRDRIEALLEPWVADRHDRAFLARCLVEEGPAHHRGANYALLLLLERVRRRVCGDPGAADAAAGAGGERLPFAMRLPPHLEDDREEDEYPLSLPVGALSALGTDLDAMVDCLTDGPPQHAVANVVMVNLLQAILDALDGAPG
jgi:hypothetical protein